MIITELGDQETYTVKNELESLFVQKDVLDKNTAMRTRLVGVRRRD